MEKLTKQKKIRVIKENNQTKKNKRIKVQSNNVIIRYDPNKIFLDFNQ